VSSLKSPWAEILVAWRVEEVEGEPRCSKLINAEETEMPRSRARPPSNPSDPLPRAARSVQSHSDAELPRWRPRLRVGQHTDYLDHTGADAIDDDPGCAADDQLARQ
jgi:hypothetical protein